MKQTREVTVVVTLKQNFESAFDFNSEDYNDTMCKEMDELDDKLKSAIKTALVGCNDINVTIEECFLV